MECPRPTVSIRKSARPCVRTAAVWQVSRANLVRLRGGVRRHDPRPVGLGSAGLSAIAHGMSLALLLSTPFFAPSSVGDARLMAVTYLGYEPPRPPETPPEPPPEAPPAEEIVDPDEPEPPIPDNPGAVPLPPVMPDDPSPVAAAVPPLDPPDSGVVPDHAMAASMAATSAQDREDRLKAAIGRHLRYPESARRRGEEGRLAVHLVISPDGRAEGLSITPADASARLVRAVEYAIRRALPCEGVPAGTYSIPITFRLTEARISPI